MRKYKLTSALAEEIAKDVVRNEESWRRYLNTASRLYKYPFKEQLSIYAQGPDATACASIEIWNEKMHCWVNKGANGIALIDEDSFSGLKYVFDISDVHKARRIGQFPNLWEMREEHMEAVLSRLEKTYGDTDREAGFVVRIRGIAGRIAEDCYKELALDMEYFKEGEVKEPETEKSDVEQLNKRLSEMSAVEKICSALDWEDVVGWNEDTQAVTITDGERALEGKEVYDLLFAEAADYVMMQTISGKTQKALEMDGLLKEAGHYAARYEGKIVAEQTEEQPLTADDVENLVLIDREYIKGTRTMIYDFECDIRGEHDKLQYMLEYHDDGEGFTIHTEKDDIWERLPESELARLEGILGREVNECG